MENGSWRLEDNEKSFQNSLPSIMPSLTNVPPQSVMAIKKDSKKKKSKDSSTVEDGTTTENILLRRPSIKKIRALFQKDSSVSKDAVASDVADQENNVEILSALSKLPKVESIR
jgi:hypothetical protein